MTVRLVTALLALAVLACGDPAAQAPPPKVPHVIPVLIVNPAIRDSLAKVWDETDAYQSERAYCVAWHGAIAPDVDTHLLVAMLRLDSLVKVDTISMSNGYAITFRCRQGTIPLHVHTPASCEGGAPVRGLGKPVCEIGGPDAYECYASPTDVRSLEMLGLLFGVIACGPHQLVMFFPRPPEER